MKNEVVHEFLGLVNNIEITDENIYFSLIYLLEAIEDKFGEVYNDDFVKDLSICIETLYFKYDIFSFVELEEEFDDCIQTALYFEDIEFQYYGNDWKIEWFNQKIKDGEYTLN